MEHVTVAHRDKTPCSYCQKNVKNIQMHLEKFHSEKLKMVSCTKCAYAVYNEDRLANHIRKQHENRGGRCEKCNKRFRDLETHIKRHYINKFECIPCSKNYSVKRDLCKHILYEHEKKRSSCDTCGKTVTNLKKHMLFNHPEMAYSVEDDEKLNRDRIWAELGDAWQYRG